MADIHKLIATISPDVYCDPEVREKVKAAIKEKGYQEALKIVEPIKGEMIDLEKTRMSPMEAKALKTPIEKHKLIYDSMTESLEPLYFWILDFTNKMFKKVDKINDNFVASPGSGYFSELGQKATAMQEKAMSMLGTVNTVLKSILNIIYDLKEFKIRLELYDDLKSKDKGKKDAAYYSLKQIWMDNVDIKRGNTSIKGLVAQFDYVTIIDAFMVAEDANSVDKIDLNDRVKRIVKQRVEEFNRWVRESETEMRKRYEIERQYLKSQYNNIQLYSRWITPYLKSANRLEQNIEPSASLVNTFNTIILELSLLCQSGYDPNDDVDAGNLPASFSKVKTRKYYSVVAIDLNFRGIPQRVGQGYSYGGRTEITFTSYALNEQEIEIFKKESEKSNFGDVLSLIEGSTNESIAQIKDDIEMFITEEKEENKKEEKTDDSNPFSALFSGFGTFFKTEKKEDEKEDLTKGIRKDDAFEKIIRAQAVIDSSEKCRTLFDTYKKAHMMPAWP